MFLSDAKPMHPSDITPAANLCGTPLGVGSYLSPTLLIQFLGCEHQVALRLAGISLSDQDDETQALFRTKGLEHQASVLERLERTTEQAAVRIPTTGVSLEERVHRTLDAISSGARVIYQAALVSGRWLGFADFLVRMGGDSRPEDAKLSKSAKLGHVLQLGTYAELLNRTTGTAIREGVIHGSVAEPERFDLAQTEHIVRRLMHRLEDFAAAEPKLTRALRCPACKTCGYKSRCESEWRQADSPIFVAGLRTGQLLKLEAAGIRTMSDLTDVAPGLRVRGIGEETLPKLVSQARLQKAARETGIHSIELLPLEAGRGFTLLPPPNGGDLWLDLEGDPLHPEGLEYLFGLFGPLGHASEPVYRCFWAHNHNKEKAAFERVIDLITAHLERFPGSHLYHYASYEITAFKRLAMRYATREQKLDRLLREHRFVDLYRVLRQSIRASTENYSLKTLEALYWGGRAGEVANAADSIVQYEQWRLTHDLSTLAQIEEYNREDCLSTAKLHEWLEGLRPKGGSYRAPISPSDEETTGSRAAEREARERELTRLAQRVRTASVGDEKLRDLVAELLWFHQRSQKPHWWAIFERQTWSDDELIDDAESLGAITFDVTAPVETVKRSNLLTCKFPPQDTKFKAGSTPVFPDTLTAAGKVASIACEDGVLVLKRGVGQDDLPAAFSLLPQKPVNQTPLSDAVKSFAERFAAGALDQDRALMDVLLRNPPRIRGSRPGADLLAPREELLSGTIRTIQAMDHTALFIQGPPGSGKTYTASHAILALLKDGKRVGVASNSHKAINLLLKKVEERAIEDGFAFAGVKKASAQNDESYFEGECITSVEASLDVGREHQLVGGTAFHFAHEELESYDYLFVDEAGQVALANLVAMAGCAKNLVLIGDQMQLAQPIQGVHPGETGLSCLTYLLQHQATIPPKRGILLNISYRLHPALCEFVSEAVYDGRLTSADCASERMLILNDETHPTLKPAGISFCIVRHQGCTQSSLEEAKAVTVLVRSLLKQRFRDEKGAIRPLLLEDILIVSPFNMQVNALRQSLPNGARVGTVDKFQGQEAPVLIVSMATSHGDDAPRGTEFLFSRNRFNVAISRAQCLAIVVQSPRLLDVSAGSIEDLIRLNLFARAEAGAKVVEG